MDAVIDILRTRSELSIMITGHSMGGAMATFCALDLAVSLALHRLMKFEQVGVMELLLTKFECCSWFEKGALCVEGHRSGDIRATSSGKLCFCSVL